MQKAFKVTLIPSRSQEVLINKTIGCARFVYNRFLARRKELYESEQKTLNYTGCSKELTQLKKEIDWLSEVDKFALQNSLKNLEVAYKNFFAGLKKSNKNRKVGFPKFKKKRGLKQSYKTNFTNGNIQVRENYLKLPKLGWVRFHKSQEIDGTIVNVTVTHTYTGARKLARRQPPGSNCCERYIASILCETEIKKHFQVTTSIGLDLGLKSFLVTSTGEEVKNPKHYRRLQKKLRSLHKKLSRSSKTSNNRVKVRAKRSQQLLSGGYLQKSLRPLVFTNASQILEMIFSTSYLQGLFEKMQLSVSKICE